MRSREDRPEARPARPRRAPSSRCTARATSGTSTAALRGRGRSGCASTTSTSATRSTSSSLTLAASGSAALDTHFKFVPLDVGGHILCPFEWTADKNITTSVPPQSIGAGVSLARGRGFGCPEHQGRLDELPIKLHFEPSPLSLVLQNVNFTLACPVAAGLINGITLGLGPFIPEFLKDYTYKLAPLTFSFAPDLPAQSILGHSVKPKLSETASALVVCGVP